MPVMKGTTVTDATAGSERPADLRGRLADEPHDAPGVDRAAVLRAALVEKLLADKKITSPVVEAAFRAVARERFLPDGVALDIAYGVDSSVVTKRDEHGVALSSVSAAYIQARMLEQAELRAGMTVLEVGSGGLNAAYIAEIVGEKGHVVSVDIDPEVTDRAARLLDEAGYAGRVTVTAVDASHGVPDEGPFAAIIVHGIATAATLNRCSPIGPPAAAPPRFPPAPPSWTRSTARSRSPGPYTAEPRAAQLRRSRCPQTLPNRKESDIDGSADCGPRRPRRGCHR
jgi:protein-L-isoaspartate(D-aspartate) O-methyltransferase